MPCAHRSESDNKPVAAVDYRFILWRHEVETDGSVRLARSILVGCVALRYTGVGVEKPACWVVAVGFFRVELSRYRKMLFLYYIDSRRRKYTGIGRAASRVRMSRCPCALCRIIRWEFYVGVLRVRLGVRIAGLHSPPILSVSIVKVIQF